MVKQPKCCICGDKIEREIHTGWRGGHNALPVKDGRCCSVCNDMVVIPARINMIMDRPKE